MPGAVPTNQYVGSFHFRIWVEGINDPLDGFTHCSGLQWSCEDWLVDHGAYHGENRAYPGRNRFEPLELERVYAGHDDFYKWREAIVAGFTDRRNVRIEILRTDHSVVTTYDLTGAWPSGWDSPESNAQGSDGSLEVIELEFETIIQS